MLDNQPRHYLILVAKSIRLSEVVLDCIETELRGNPQLRELQFRRTTDSLCVFGLSEVPIDVNIDIPYRGDPSRREIQYGVNNRET